MEIITVEFTKALQKLSFGIEANNKDISTCRNLYTVEGHIGLGSVSDIHLIWSLVSDIYETMLFIFKDLPEEGSNSYEISSYNTSK